MQGASLEDAASEVVGEAGLTGGGVDNDHMQ